MAKAQVIDNLDHPLPFLMGTTLFVIGFSGILLWLFRNLNLSGAAHAVQQG